MGDYKDTSTRFSRKIRDLNQQEETDRMIAGRVIIEPGDINLLTDIAATGEVQKEARTHLQRLFDQRLIAKDGSLFLTEKGFATLRLNSRPKRSKPAEMRQAHRLQERVNRFIPKDFSIDAFDTELCTTTLRKKIYETITHQVSRCGKPMAMYADIKKLDFDRATLDVIKRIQDVMKNIIKFCKPSMFTTRAAFDTGRENPFIRACEAHLSTTQEKIGSKSGAEIINELILPKAVEDIISQLTVNYLTRKKVDPNKPWGELTIQK